MFESAGKITALNFGCKHSEMIFFVRIRLGDETYCKCRITVH